MIARFEHHPILMEMALATLVCVLLVALTLFVTVQAVRARHGGSRPRCCASWPERRCSAAAR